MTIVAILLAASAAAGQEQWERFRGYGGRSRYPPRYPTAASFDGAPKPLNAESQFTFMIVELGIAGLLVYMAFQARILAGVVAGLRWLRDTEARLLVVALVTPLVAFMALWVTGVTTTSSPNAPYIWFAAGTAMWWMYRSEPLESRRRSAPPGLRMDAGRERELAPA